MRSKAFRYGIEIEALVPREFRNELDNSLEEIPGVREVKEDGSLSVGRGQMSFEVVTNPLTYSQMVRTIKGICAVFDLYEVETNRSCGLHIHTSHPKFFKRKYANRIIHTWASVEDVMIATQPPSRLNNSYCQRFLVTYTQGLLDKLPAGKQELLSKLSESRRHSAINMGAMRSHGTVEVRLHAGTANPQKINNWLELVRLFFAYCVEEYNSEVVNGLFQTKISDKKVNDTFKMLGLSDNLVKYFKTRLRTMLYKTLAIQQESAVKIQDKKEALVKMKAKYDKIATEYNTEIGSRDAEVSNVRATYGSF